MAQTTRSSSSRSTRSRSSSTRSKSRNGAAGSARSSSKRSGSTKGRSTASRRSSTSGSQRTSAGTRGRQTSQNGAVAKAGGKVAELASKAKTPLVAGGAALAGIAGGVALKSRNDSRRPLHALRSVHLPKSVKNMDLSKVDVDKLMNTARQVRSFGEQVGDVVDAAEKTRKKHK